MTTAWDMWTEAATTFAGAARAARIPPILLQPATRADLHHVNGWIIPVTYYWTSGAQPIDRLLSISESGQLANVQRTPGYIVLDPITRDSEDSRALVTPLEKATFAAALAGHLHQVHSSAPSYDLPLTSLSNLGSGALGR